jgi:hypothetical protein
MQFTKENILNILKVSLDNRFENFNAFDFEDFIAQLFRDNGYIVEQTQYVGDYGADLIITIDNEKTAVQVKRYSPQTKVGVKDLNQLIGSKEYYKCSKSLIITTSSFTKQASNLANETGAWLWDWSMLYQFICATYLGGKDHIEFFNPQQITETEDFTASIKKIENNVSMKGNYIASLVYVEIKNNTNKHQDVAVGLPTIITKDNRQISARHYLEGYFNSGKIYSGCVVESCFIFEKAQLPIISSGDKLVIDLSTDLKNYTKTIVFQYSPTSLTNKCFIATAVYGTQMTREINILRNWRDDSLMKTSYGKKSVNVYYKLSPPIAYYISKNETRKKFIRTLLKPLIKVIKEKHPNYDYNFEDFN